MLAVANITTTTTITQQAATTTLTGSVTTQTVQAQPFLLFGLPPELLGIAALATVAIVYAFFKFQVKGVPVLLVWIYKNGSALMLKAQEDLQGIFLTVLKGSKKVETLKKTGLPLQVKYLPNKFSAYIDTPKDRTIDDPTLRKLEASGFKITPTKYSRKGLAKGYLVSKEPSLTNALAYLDINLGGLKTARLYAAIEGQSQTVDWMPKIQGTVGTADSGNTTVIHEMKSALKAFLALLAEAMKGTFQALILPLIAGIGMGGMIVFILLELLGRLK